MAIWYLARPEPLLVQGEAESTRVDIAARVSGRLAKIAVARGQNVAAGATLLVIDNPELVAELREAEAAKLIADAELSRINVGTRAEIIAQRKAEIDRATADVTLAQQTYDRTKQLAAAQFAPQSKLDQDTNALTLAQKRLDQAKLGISGGGQGLHRRGAPDRRGECRQGGGKNRDDQGVGGPNDGHRRRSPRRSIRSLPRRAKS